MIDADQHEDARGAETGGFLDRLSQRSDQVGAVEFARQRIDAVTPQTLQEVFRKYFPADRSTVITLMPAAAQQ